MTTRRCGGEVYGRTLRYAAALLAALLAAGGATRLEAEPGGSPPEKLPTEVTVISPNGGEDVPANHVWDILFTVTGDTVLPGDPVTIEYQSVSFPGWTVCYDTTGAPAFGVPYEAGSFEWDTRGITPGQYEVRVTYNPDPGIFDVSDSPFDIVMDIQVVVLSPNGGEEVAINHYCDILFACVGDSLLPDDTVRIEYQRVDSPGWQMCYDMMWHLAHNVPHDVGKFRWNTEMLEPGSYEVRVTLDTGPDSISDVSDDPFDVVLDIEITVVSPNGGEDIPTNHYCDIAFTCEGDSLGSPYGSVTIEYESMDWPGWQICYDMWGNPAFDVPRDAGTFRWNTDGIYPGPYRVRVSLSEDPTVGDESDSLFDVVLDIEIRVVSPNGGEGIPVNHYHDITFTCTGDSLDPSDTVRIEYRETSSGSWYTCYDTSGHSGDNVPLNAGSFRWDTGYVYPGRYEARVVLNSYWPDVYDVCDHPFDIVLDIEITVVSPNGYEDIPVNHYHDITFTCTGDSLDPDDAVRIEYQNVDSPGWQTCYDTSGYSADYIPCDAGIFRWDTSYVYPGQYEVRVSHNDWPEAFDVCDGPFDIVMDIQIEVTSPNGGEDIPVGHYHDITFTCTGDSLGPDDTVQIEYQNVDLPGWYICWDISGYPADNVPCDAGSFRWATGGLSPGRYEVRVSCNYWPEVYDVCDAPFDLFLDIQVEVLSPNGGEEVLADHFCDITFAVTGHSLDPEDTVRIEYQNVDFPGWIVCWDILGYPADFVPHDAGLLQWDTEGIPPGQYEVRVTVGYYGPEVCDVSDAPFDIVAEILPVKLEVRPAYQELSPGQATGATYGLYVTQIEPHAGLDAKVYFHPGLLDVLGVEKTATTASGTLGWSVTPSAPPAYPGYHTLNVFLFAITPEVILPDAQWVRIEFQARVDAPPDACSEIALGPAQVDEEIPQTKDGQICIVPSWDLGGLVVYYREDSVEPSAVPVPDTDIRLQGPAGLDLTLQTNPDGDYLFTGLTNGLHTLTPSRPDGDLDLAVSNFDATLIMDDFLGYVDLTALQEFAGDVTGNGGLSNLDATHIMYRWLGSESEWPNDVPDWAFEPASRQYNLAGDVLDADFWAICIGDVSGNWSELNPPARPVRVAPAAADTPALELDEYEAEPDDVLDVPVYVTTTATFAGFQMTIDFDPSVIEVLDVLATPLSGDLAGFDYSIAPGPPATLRIFGFGSMPKIQGSGARQELCVIVVRCIGADGSRTDLDLTSGMLDETIATLDDGEIAIETMACGLDVDANGIADALTDGIVVLRYLFGFRGAPLVENALAPDARRTDPDDIAAALDLYLTTMLDPDDNGGADALTDGIVILRYLFGFRGVPLVDGALAPDANRTDPDAIAAFLDGFLP